MRDALFTVKFQQTTGRNNAEVYMENPPNWREKLQDIEDVHHAITAYMLN